MVNSVSKEVHRGHLLPQKEKPSLCFATLGLSLSRPFQTNTTGFPFLLPTESTRSLTGPFKEERKRQRENYPSSAFARHTCRFVSIRASCQQIKKAQEVLVSSKDGLVLGFRCFYKICTQ